MSRFCAILFWIMIGASVTQAEWPIPTANGTTWRYAFTREGETKPGTLTCQVFAPENPEEQSILRIETLAPNGIITALSPASILICRSRLLVKATSTCRQGDSAPCIFGEKKMTACLRWPTFGLSAESARSRKRL